MSAEQDTAMFDQPDGDTRPATRLSRNLLLARLGDAERERDALAAVIEQVRALMCNPDYSLYGERFIDTLGRILTTAPTAALEAVKAEALEEAATASEGAFLMHEMPSPGDGPFTVQQRAADEARQQIAAKIRTLVTPPASKTDTKGGALEAVKAGAWNDPHPWIFYRDDSSLPYICAEHPYPTRHPGEWRFGYRPERNTEPKEV